MLPTFDKKLSGPAGEKPATVAKKASSNRFKRGAILAIVLGTFALAFCSLENQYANALNDKLWAMTHTIQGEAASSASLCPQQDPYKLTDGFADLDQEMLAEKLSKAVQIDTTVGDEWPDPIDEPERWAAFPKFADWLRQEFPKVHEKLDLEKVHEHGLLYTWKGSNPDLKPLLMMAHQDVVPVNQGTLDQWQHPPFSGFVDRETETVWGRGSTDCKAWLVSILASVEELLAKGWEPMRTVLLSFGFDEESGGKQGAGYLAKRVEEIWGRGSIAMIVDEGNPVLGSSDPSGPGVDVALPGIAEKGSVDIEVLVEAPGGHSSMAGAHTSIGLLARVVARLEDSRDRLDETKIGGPQLEFLQCIRDGPRIPPALRSALRDLERASKSSLEHLSLFSHVQAVLPDSLGSLVLRALNSWSDRGRQRRMRRARERVVHVMPPQLQTQFVTTTAVDIIHGGVKFNALPESASAFVDHRIAITSSYAELKKHYVDVLTPVAEQYNMEMVAFGKTITNGTKGVGAKATTAAKLTIKEARDPLEPAPWTPLRGEQGKPFQLFSQIVRSVWQGQDGKPVIVAPSIMTGNTDTRYYHNLTHNIIRFGPNTIKPDKTGLGTLTGIHTVNEHYPMQGLSDSANFYTALFQAVSNEDI